MPTVRPFRPLRFDPAVAGPLDRLVAPPYDVISDEARAEYLARSPYNIVHLTLPDTPEQAARALADWRASGVLVEGRSSLLAHRPGLRRARTASRARARASARRSR